MYIYYIFSGFTHYIPKYENCGNCILPLVEVIPTPENHRIYVAGSFRESRSNYISEILLMSCYSSISCKI